MQTASGAAPNTIPVAKEGTSAITQTSWDLVNENKGLWEVQGGKDCSLSLSLYIYIYIYLSLSISLSLSLSIYIYMFCPCVFSKWKDLGVPQKSSCDDSYTILYYTTLYYTTLYYTTLYSTILYYTTLSYYIPSLEVKSTIKNNKT